MNDRASGSGGMASRWPKGPFPERYRFGAVEARLASSWSDDDATRLAPITDGLALLPPHDPWLRLYCSSALSDEAWHASLRERARELGATAFVWIPSARERRESDPATARDVIGIVPTLDLVDAVSAVGVAGPNHGIGLPAIVRFLVTLRTFGRSEVEAMGEDAIVIRYVPRADDPTARVAERVLKICPPLARTSSAEAVAAQMREHGRIRMDFA